MIPIKDDIPHEKPPIITTLLIVVNVIIFFYELSLGRELNIFIFRYGAIPYKIIHEATYPTIITSMFLHGGFGHLLGNMLYLWIFGDNVEDAFGHLRFLFMYLLWGIVGSGLHILTAVNSRIPSIGASGAISGVLGAYLVLYPRARVLTLIPFGFFLRLVALPAFILLGFWIILQLIFGAASLAGGASGVAWFAHIGGFFMGIISGIAIKRRREW